MHKLLMTTVAIVLALTSAGTGMIHAADTTPDKADARPAEKKPVKMNEPMRGGMKKEGMTMGDVKTAAEKKDAEMKKMMDEETKSARQAGKK